MKISVVTPSIRLEMLQIVNKCLNRQTFTDYEWLVVSPFEYAEATWIPEPKKKDGDFYNLNKAWNAAFKQAKGELIVSIVDGLWFNPRLLEQLWSHYVADKTKCVGLIGNQYDEVINGRPEHIMWNDPRRKGEAFYQVDPIMFELCIASIPKAGIYEVGGMDPEYDQCAAVSEKELCKRMEKAGYTFWLDETIEYRAIYHPRIKGTDEWDKHYHKAEILYTRHVQEIADGKRYNIGYL